MQRENVKMLLEAAPHGVKERIQPIVESESAYLNYPNIEKLLKE
jgi:hypothetical protein